VTLSILPHLGRLHLKYKTILYFNHSIPLICIDIDGMTPIHAKVASAKKDGDQYRLIVDLVPAEFLGPFERLRFKGNPYCGSFSTSLTGNWLTLTYRKDPGYKEGDKFPLSRTD
jgi:hypothetical protein